MQKDTKKLIVILSIGLICSIIFLGFCILYGLTHQATRHDKGLDVRDIWDPYSDFVIENIN